ncbi:MAG: LysR family transcriptional regulator [Pigmentiphaga sp.]|nr:LysR family transcriptional regulator [Pigmentiphaga sp.]
MRNKADLTALRYFVAVAEQGNYSKAAAALQITQPAISRQIQTLERGYKVRLFRREGRRLEATEAGEQLLNEAKAILARFDALEHTVSMAAKAPSGILSIGITWATWATWESLLPQVLTQFRAKYPGVFLRVMKDAPDRLTAALMAHRIHLAILTHSPTESELETLPLMTTSAGLIAPYSMARSVPLPRTADPSISFAQALALPLILAPKGRALRDLIDVHAERQGIRPNLVMESDSLPLSKSLVLEGHGFTIATQGSVYDEVLRSKCRFIPIHSPILPWRMYAATSKSHSQTLAQQAMMREIRDFIRARTVSPAWSD